MNIERLTGTKELDQKLQGLILHVNSINELINRIAESSDVDTIFSTLVEGIRTELGYERVGILVPGDSREEMRMAWALGLEAERAENVRVPMERVQRMALDVLGHRRVNVLRCLKEEEISESIYGALEEESRPCALVPFAAWHQKRCWEIDYCLLGHSALAGVPGAASRVKVGGDDLLNVCRLCEFFPLRGLLWVDQGTSSASVRENLFPLWVLAKQAALAIENAVLYERSRRLSIRDGLTGLYNRRHMFEVIDYEVERSRRFKHPFTLLVVDVDDFAAVNEEHGFKGGDELIRYLAVLLRRSVRDVDVLFRCGTDAFAVLFPKTEGNLAMRIGNRLRERIAGFPFHLSGKDVRVSVSGGIATFPEDGQNARDLLYLAEKGQAAVASGGGDGVRDASQWRA